MAIFIKPEYFQIIHYYFFALGIFSLTIAFLFPDYNAFTILFMSFYVVHSGISWYMSWFMYKKLQMVFIIHKSKYILEHIVLTVVSGSMAITLYYMFQTEYEALMTSVITVNFFVMFLGAMWYIMGLAKISEKFFDWQEARRMEVGRDMVFSFRKKKNMKLMDDETIKRYKFGSDSHVDSLVAEAKSNAKEGRDFSEQVRDIEVRMAQIETDKLREKIARLEEGIVTEAERNLVHSYMKAINEQEIRIMNYEKEFKKRELLKKA